MLAVWCLNMMRPAFLHSFDGPQMALGFAVKRDYCRSKPASQWTLKEVAACANRWWADIQEMQQTNRTPVDEQALPGQGAGEHPYNAWHPPARKSQQQFQGRAPIRGVHATTQAAPAQPATTKQSSPQRLSLSLSDAPSAGALTLRKYVGRSTQSTLQRDGLGRQPGHCTTGGSATGGPRACPVGHHGKRSCA